LHGKIIAAHLRCCALRRRVRANATTPRIIPTIIDSDGKPGIGGNASGVILSVELDLWDVVAVVEAVLVIAEVTEFNVLTELVCSGTAVVELVEVDVGLLVVVVAVWVRDGLIVKAAKAESPT